MKKKIIIIVSIIVLLLIAIVTYYYLNKPYIKMGYEGGTAIQVVGAETPYEYYEIYKSGKIKHISGADINAKGREEKENRIVGKIQNNKLKGVKEKLLEYANNSNAKNGSIYYVTIDNKKYNISQEEYNRITNLIKENINN